MEPFTTLTAIGLPLLRANVDTDAIIPSREMKSASKTGLADGLFAGWRYAAIGSREPAPGFVLNDPAYHGAQILLGGENFGCGSSREHAVWALLEYGFRCVIAASFAPIFQNNCIRNGVLPVQLPAAAIAQLDAWLSIDPQARLLTVDLPQQRVRTQEAASFGFQIDALSKEMLLAGLDEIDLTLSRSALIREFLAADRLQRPWIYS
jgi:3-isopropylmalate/(R)-2-methylmalate dehydratase small subunit